MAPKEIKLEVFDPFGCRCSGPRGPEAEATLLQFSADLDWLRTQGIAVERYDPSHRYGAFLDNAEVVKAVNQHGLRWLPLILFNGEVVSHGRYPDNEELSAMVGLGRRSTTSPLI